MTIPFRYSPQPAGPPYRPISAAVLLPETRITGVRLDSIDLLRGLIMLLMALDHTRDFFGTSGMNPRDVTDPALFLTRWVTHFCAPLFIFLAGAAAFLHGTRGQGTGQLSRFLFTRGLWLAVLEFTLVRFAWTFSTTFDFFVLQVIWAIGVSMMALSAFVWLPRTAIAAAGLVLIAGHNLFDGLRPEDLGAAGWIWNLLHQPGMLAPAPGIHVYVLYPLIPWIGVMAAGYALGPEFLNEPVQRRRRLFALGAVLTAGFLVLRLANLYGDPAPWTPQNTVLSGVLSVLNAEKYPPSLLYLLMTLGPGLMLLALFEHSRGRLASWITVFGRVPLFYYAAHLFLLHGLAVTASLVLLGDGSWLMNAAPSDKPAGWGLPLPGVYGVWLLAIAALYPLCRWFAGVKRRRRDWWLSYL